MAFDIRNLFGPGAFNMLMQPRANAAGAQNMLMTQPGPAPTPPIAPMQIDPQTTAAVAGPAPVAPQNPVQVAQQGSSSLFGLDPDREQFLQDMFLGWAAGKDPSQSLALGAAQAASGRRDRKGTNQTVDWLKGKGMDEASARQLAANPSALGDYIRQVNSPQDPMKALNLEKANLEIDALRHPKAEEPKIVELFDEATGQPYKAQWNAGSNSFERVGGVKARSGMQLTTNPDGTVSLTEGTVGNLPKLTEAEGKNSGFYGRGIESQKILNGLEGQGTSLWNNTVGKIPVVGNFAVSENAQKYDQAKRNFVNAVLRRESGAVISPEEFANAERQYFPQPGDGADVIEQKRNNRDTTIQGLKISSGQGAAFATPQTAQPSGAPQAGTIQDGYRFKGGNPADPNSWEKAQ